MIIDLPSAGSADTVLPNHRASRRSLQVGEDGFRSCGIGHTTELAGQSFEHPGEFTFDRVEA